MRAGDASALEALYFLYFQDLLRYSFYFLHDEDACKEYINKIFANLWQKRESLTEVTNPKAYIFTALKNLILFRKESKAALMLVFPGDEHIKREEDFQTSCEEAIIESEDIKARDKEVEDALLLLPKRQRQIVVARFIEEKSYQEIADEFDLSVRRVYNSIHESLKLLRTRFSPYLHQK